MSTELNTGGPAFPCGPDLDASGMPRTESWYGMTLRDYFAAKAMQGMILLRSYNGTALQMAEESYDMADAMLKARKL